MVDLKISVVRRSSPEQVAVSVVAWRCRRQFCVSMTLHPVAELTAEQIGWAELCLDGLGWAT